MNVKDTVIVIPARIDSSRLPRKLMLEIEGKPILQHTYERALESGFPVVIATPDQEIRDFVVNKLKGQAILTGQHENGTSRCIEAFNILDVTHDYKYMINVQGDEPMIDPSILMNISDRLMQNADRSCDIVTVGYQVPKGEEVRGNSEVFIAKNIFNEAMYFSRSVIPYVRDCERSLWSQKYTYLRHLGIYGFNTSVLSDMAKLSESDLEQVEKLEQLKWLEYGYRVGVIETDINMHSVDTEKDLKLVRSIFNDK